MQTYFYKGAAIHTSMHPLMKQKQHVCHPDCCDGKLFARILFLHVYFVSEFTFVFLYLDGIVYDRVQVTEKKTLFGIVLVCHILINLFCYGGKGNFVSQDRRRLHSFRSHMISGLTLISLTCISLLRQVANIISDTSQHWENKILF